LELFGCCDVFNLGIIFGCYSPALNQFCLGFTSGAVNNLK